MILRKSHKTHFTIIDNKALRNKSLSFKSTGLLCYLLSLPDDFDISIRYLATVKLEGREAVASAMGELSDAGYIRRGFTHVKDGKNISRAGVEMGRSVPCIDITEIPNVFTESDIVDLETCPTGFPSDRKPDHTEVKSLKSLKNLKESAKPAQARAREDQDKKPTRPSRHNHKFSQHKAIAEAAFEMMAQTPTPYVLELTMGAIDDCSDCWTVEEQVHLLPALIKDMQSRSETIHVLHKFIEYHGSGKAGTHPYGRMTRAKNDALELARQEVENKKRIAEEAYMRSPEGAHVNALISQVTGVAPIQPEVKSKAPALDLIRSRLGPRSLNGRKKTFSPPADAEANDALLENLKKLAHDSELMRDK